jgi:hypothetical protein
MRLLSNSGQNSLPVESLHTRVWEDILLEHRSKLAVDGLFREAVGAQWKDNIPLLNLVHSDDLKYGDIVSRFFNLFFQGLFVWVSFIDCEGSIPWVIFDTPIAKVVWWFRAPMLMNSWDTLCLMRFWQADLLSEMLWKRAMLASHHILQLFADHSVARGESVWQYPFKLDQICERRFSGQVHHLVKS